MILLVSMDLMISLLNFRDLKNVRDVLWAVSYGIKLIHTLKKESDLINY